MKREHLEHLLRASAAILITRGSRKVPQELVVIGSQSILGQYPEAPAALLRSMEADIYPLNEPALADEIDGAIGELSPFHDTYGYYVQGVGPNTATLPARWLNRVVRVQNDNTGQGIGLCLEVHDLAISKYVAGRDKDASFTLELAQHAMIKRSVLETRLAATMLPEVVREIVRQRITSSFR